MFTSTVVPVVHSYLDSARISTRWLLLTLDSRAVPALFFIQALLRRPRFSILSCACVFVVVSYQATYLKSDSKVIELRAHGGWLSLLNTEVSMTWTRRRLACETERLAQNEE